MLTRSAVDAKGSKVGYCKPHSACVFLTVDFAVVGAAVKEDAHGLLASIADRVAVDLDVVAPLRGDDAWSVC